MKKKKIKIDDFHIHEAMDRACLVGQFVDTTLCSHPAIKQDKKLKKKVDKAMTLIFEVYQELGNKD